MNRIILLPTRSAEGISGRHVARVVGWVSSYCHYRGSGLVQRRLWKGFHNRRNWLFSWTESGAEQVGIIQSLLVTCKLHDVNPYEYLVDVLQRVGNHPASRVEELTPRLWKEHFADNPLRSDLERLTDGR